jgi:hypothetical protein
MKWAIVYCSTKMLSKKSKVHFGPNAPLILTSCHDGMPSKHIMLSFEKEWLNARKLVSCRDLRTGITCLWLQKNANNAWITGELRKRLEIMRKLRSMSKSGYLINRNPENKSNDAVHEGATFTTMRILTCYGLLGLIAVCGQVCK